jgi:hypothetical protein
MNIRALLCGITAALFGASATIAGPATAPKTADSVAAPLPQYLRDTGLYAAGSVSAVRGGNVAFSPQYPLWSDGASKRRWIHLPPGSAIDASRPDAWEFPPGTKLWKEFSHERRVETRFIERLADGSWRYATYVWNEEGTDAVLASAEGAVVAARSAANGRYTIPSREDCLACHEGRPVPVLGFSVLQLSPDRDPLAPHAEPSRPEYADLERLVSRGLIRNLPQSLIDKPPRIDAPTPTARAALGYLHANCGHCHNDAGALAGLDLVLAQQASTSAADAAQRTGSLVAHSSRFRPHGAVTAQRVVPGDAAASVITMRMRSGNALARMPPLGVQIVDVEGIALVERWIQHDLDKQPEPSR